NTGFAQEVDNPKEELLQTTWNLKKIVFEDVDYYFLSTPSLDQVILEINPPVQGNEGFDLLTNFCDAGSGWLIFEEENEFYMTYFGYGILAKNMSDIDFCNLPFPEEVEGYVTEELYIDEFFWNE